MCENLKLSALDLKRSKSSAVLFANISVQNKQI